MINKTGITDLSKFDSTIDTDAIQRLVVNDTYDHVGDKFLKAKFLARELYEKDIIEKDDYLRARSINLEVTNNTQPNKKHQLANYDFTVASAKYIKYIDKNIGCVDIVMVQDQLQSYGIGTQMKKLLLNHMEQDSISVAYTYIGSRGGSKLALNTGFYPDREQFPETDRIWKRTF